MTALSDLRAAVARVDKVLGCAGTCRFKTPMGQTTNGRCDCLEQPHATMVLAALYKAAKALVAAEEPRERWVNAEGVTRLPKAMREELGVGDGAHIWFLRGPERWEAWQESEVSDLFGGEPISESAIRAVNAAMAQEPDGDAAMFAEAFDEACAHVNNAGFAGAAQSEFLAERGLTCGCWKCLAPFEALPFGDPMRVWWMVVCPQCGNKRCPRATSHDNTCSGSNEPGQEGSER